MKVLKVVVLGADKVGKSSLLERFLLPDNPLQPNLDSTLSKDIYNVNSKTVPFPGRCNFHAYYLSELLRNHFLFRMEKSTTAKRLLICFSRWDS